MAKYKIEVHAYQEVEVEADNDEEAIRLAIEEGVDLGCAEWTTNTIFKQEESDDRWEKVR